ncbi:6428_t:CDS:1, partial [Dentiscutata erythropus]
VYRQVTNRNRKRQHVRRPRSRRNSSRVVVPRPKGPHYAKTPVIALPDTTINKLVTWERGRYKDILNRNGQVTNRYKGSIYIEKIRSNSQVHYSPVHKLPE